jgi:hypothetical protein
MTSMRHEHEDRRNNPEEILEVNLLETQFLLKVPVKTSAFVYWFAPRMLAAQPQIYGSGTSG